ncbi:ATP-binding protein [Methanomethylovorans sp.]|uniref:ATP-binding protein n=1 Tax=Methanomethylovorans sp. TaxID=2758717 RepID=UPI00351C71EA
MNSISDTFGAGVAKNRYVLGRRNKEEQGLLNLGRYLALDGSAASYVGLDALGPHCILICGKRGYGKSYTMGTLIEELSLLPDDIRNNIASLVIDTMGIFWTMKKSNEPQKSLLKQWSLAPKEIDIKVFVPSGSVKKYDEQKIEVLPFSIPISAMDGYSWCKLFSIDEVSPLGVLLIRVIAELRSIYESFSFDSIMDMVIEDERADNVTKNAAENYIRTASSWGIFTEEGVHVKDLVRRGCTTVLDVSTLKDLNVRAAVIGQISKEIYYQRLEARRSEERMLMGHVQNNTCMPMTWMFIDEAHLFVPNRNKTLASDVLTNEWLRQGRQPGLSLILATQRPSALDPEVTSQSDILICHRLTAAEDINALESFRPSYMKENIGDSIRKMGMEQGIAFILDDTTEAAHVIRMRPRLSWHGGNEPSALDHKHKKNE